MAEIRHVNSDRNTHLLIGFGIALAIAGILGSGNSTQGMRSATSGVALRSIGTKTLLPQKDQFLSSPFLVDGVYPSGKSEELVFFSNKGIESIQGDGEEGFRFFFESAGTAEVKFKSVSEKMERSPRVDLFNDKEQVISSLDTKDWRAGDFLKLKVPSAGLYRLRLRFPYEEMEEVRVRLHAEGETETKYSAYLQSNIKTFQIEVMPGQLGRLDEITRSRYKEWNTPITDDMDYVNASKPKERVVAKIRTPNGESALVTIGQAGRTSSHTSGLKLPSMDIRVVSGELPYGLKKFKLYSMAAKTSGRDMTLESLFGDMGTVTARGDLAKVFLNGEPLAMMEIYEEPDEPFFDYARIPEGPMLGYNTDDLASDFRHSRYKLEDDFKTTVFPLDKQMRISDPAFAKHFCKTSNMMTLAFALAYGGNHGLNQTDYKYHVNPVKGCIDPMIRDLGSDVSSIFLKSQYDYSVIYAVQEFSTYAPEWRPDVTTGSSWYRTWKPDGSSTRDTMSLWSVMPATLNYYNDAKVFSEFTTYYLRFTQDWNHQRIARRLENLGIAFKTLDSETQALFKAGLTLELPLLWKEHSPPEKYLRLVNHQEKYRSNPDSLKWSALIKKITNGTLEPDAFSMAAYAWRNEVAREIIPLINGYQPGEAAKSYTTKPGPSSAITFLYRHDSPAFTQLFFVERNIPDGSAPGGAVLGDEFGNEIDPINSLEVGNESIVHTPVDLYLNDKTTPNEHVRLYYFKIPRDEEEYLYLRIHPRGSSTYYGTRDVDIAPLAQKKAVIKFETADASKYFDIKGKQATWKSNAPAVNGLLEIPGNITLRVEKNTEVRFSKTGCLVVEGRIQVAPKATFSLLPEKENEPWAGVHFRSVPDQTLENFIVAGAGTGEETVKCGEIVYSAGASIFDSTVQLKNWKVRDSKTKNAVQIYQSAAEIDNLEIVSSSHNGLSGVYSTLHGENLKIKDSGKSKGNSTGVGVFLVGSSFSINRSEITASADTNLLATENSIGEVKNSEFTSSRFGLGAADGAELTATSSKISGNIIGIGQMRLKPYFAQSKFNLGPSVTLSENQEDIREIPFTPIPSKHKVPVEIVE